jgi:hypothetical protein
VKGSTIGRRCAAIGYAHKMAGHHDPPSNAETLKRVMRCIRRAIGTASPHKFAATADITRVTLKHCSDNLMGKWLGAAERAGEAEHEQRAVTIVKHRQSAAIR